MCGISGIIHKSGTPVAHVDIELMNDLAAHRGPDGHGLFFDKSLALGHRRLAILDVSEAGHQPMLYGDRYVLTFNGEIYNYLELREQLSQDGFEFASKTDTEVILAAYDKWGADCVSRFNGIWAFALYDKQKAEIFCSRDRFGVKPFYYADTPEKFVFGSEIKQVLSGGNVPPVANMIAVRDFLVEGYHDHTCETFFQGVHSLPAGHNLVYSVTSNRFEQTCYYSLDARAGLSDLGEHAATSLFFSDLKRAVDYQLRSDVKVGVSLSGGLDSSTLAGLSARIYNTGPLGKMQAIHAKSSENHMDESAYAREVAARADIELSVIEPTAQEFIEAIDEVVYLQEEPFTSPSIFMQYFLFQKAKRIGCKVMLDGQGCDEILLGYERYYSAHLHSMPALQAAREIFSIENNSRLTFRAIVANFAYFSVSRIRIWSLQRKFRFLKKQYTEKFPNIAKATKGSRNIRAMQKMEIESFQLPHLLRYVDRNSMRHSIEARVPFLDHDLVETCYGISNKLKIKDGWTKHILRVAMQGLVAPNILWRKNKFGFEAPDASWISEVSGTMESAVRQSPLLEKMCQRGVDVKKIDPATFWKLYSIAKWETAYSVQS
ncbi:asparagine synthase (glutamine-hydrolyzing) [Massilia sp. R2A-15]|uniref:asparagine synthase (glutamine-hydrolyzing) n=1 Tax=Massilia sp. R2A-15 TaxID=3064278 RepID=UPI002736E4B7|nr:asparagine synthase (glutamine-hydrolyzing) [Massilia sp. R2A-15]WLI88546.1 asparagine synthase (glutamine-hydrolyzing) [Massilia sp. R2A-15]